MKKLLKKLGKIISGIAAIVLLVWVYFSFIASEPIFGPEEDVALGQQVVQSIEETGEDGPVLAREIYPEAYAHMDRIVANLVDSPEIQYRDLFKYGEVRIIHNDDILNAFCTPGGYIFVYTGLIKYLEAEDHLAGVLGHEIAHAEKRHSSLRLQVQYGSERLLEFIVLTTPISARAAWALSMLGDLTSLEFSREQEAEADTYSVRYLDDTDYACDATAGFFEKLTANNAESSTPAFLSDHPSSESRIEDIHHEAESLGCGTKLGDKSQWKSFQASLPVIETSDESENSEL